MVEDDGKSVPITSVKDLRRGQALEAMSNEVQFLRENLISSGKHYMYSSVTTLHAASWLLQRRLRIEGESLERRVEPESIRRREWSGGRMRVAPENDARDIVAMNGEAQSMTECG